ncbi:NADPH:quinone oxidoreductase family protein [Xanthobacter sp. KR7-65]|uniref:NADPH:quinone oxidoreductase family protein n=1 Tax=Xanthobacter sp. KR7-65 TaxID=3156612 RepID=UPI0032B381BA
MRAVVVHAFGTPESLAVETIPDPQPRPDEVVIDVKASTANFVDTLVIAGKYQFLPPLPFTPGKGPAGVISAVGSNVKNLSVGDRVLTTAEEGGYAEKAVAKASHCYRISDNMSFIDAASISLAFDTSWFALRERAHVKPGEVVLVLGASGAVGTAAVQLAHAFGARVIGGVSSPQKAAAVREAGAFATVDLSAPDLRDSLRQQVYALNDGRGVDVVIDPIGDRFLAPALRTLDWCGRYVVVGFAAGEIPTLKVNYLLLKNIQISGLQVSDYRKRRPERMNECFKELLELYEKGAIRAPTSRPVPLEQFADALDQVVKREAGARLVLTPS